MLALQEQEDECCRVMAEVFQDPRAGWMDFIYWEDLETMETMQKKNLPGQDDSPGCVVM